MPLAHMLEYDIDLLDKTIVQSPKTPIFILKITFTVQTYALLSHRGI